MLDGVCIVLCDCCCCCSHCMYLYSNTLRLCSLLQYMCAFIREFDSIFSYFTISYISPLSAPQQKHPSAWCDDVIMYSVCCVCVCCLMMMMMLLRLYQRVLYSKNRQNIILKYTRVETGACGYGVRNIRIVMAGELKCK